VLRKALVNAAHVMSLLNLLALAVDHYIVVCSPIGTFLQRSTEITKVIVTLCVLFHDFSGLQPQVSSWIVSELH